LSVLLGRTRPFGALSSESAPPACDLKECVPDCLWIPFGISLKSV
jgi:hypothetical protein